MERMGNLMNASLKSLLNEQYKLVAELREENKKLNEKVRFLEECLDNKEKVNKSLREEIKEIEKSQEYRYHRCMKAERGGEDED